MLYFSCTSVTFFFLSPSPSSALFSDGVANVCMNKFVKIMAVRLCRVIVGISFVYILDKSKVI